MAENTSIEWTDNSWNGWIGCSRVHTGCERCYAESFAKRYGKATWGPNGTRVKTSEANWRKPLKWNREAEKAGVRRKVFCSSLADVFEDWTGPIHTHDGDELRKCGACGWLGTLPVILIQNAKRKNIYGCPRCDTEPDTEFATMNDMRAMLFALIDSTPWLDWQLLTKRPENIPQMWPRPSDYESLTAKRYNVWLGTSVSDQLTADTMIPRLLKCRDLTPVLFLSMEPLLGPVDLRRVHQAACDDRNVLNGRWINGATEYRERGNEASIDWIILGGESGPGARECDIAWLFHILTQCQDAGVPCFVKQLGSAAFASNVNLWDDVAFDSKRRWTGPEAAAAWLKLTDSKGGDWNEFPRDLVCRHFPIQEPTHVT